MKIKKIIKRFCIFLILGNLIFCDRRAETVSCFPEQRINVSLNLNLPYYADKLTKNNGWVYINEQESGTRGLILVRTGVYPNYKFKVYDRNAPHLCPSSDTTLEVKGGIKIVCPKDGAEWILTDGSPVKTSSLPPKTYPYSYNPATGIISIYY
ncbi:MAG: hypothetical protein Q4A00_02525 [Flavobacteriaceae bacterium]|nr:hypothetical protein [Flavobacteriaceae bacterium]